IDANEASAVAPRRDLRKQSRPDSNELETAAEAREADVVRRHAETRAAKQSFSVVDRLPSLLERREVPTATSRADHPEPATLGIEREPSADREGRQKVVRSQIVVAEQTTRIHRGDAAGPSESYVCRSGSTSPGSS